MAPGVPSDEKRRLDMREQADHGQVPETDETDSAALLTEISAAVRQLTDSSERYHLRAEQREA